MNTNQETKMVRVLRVDSRLLFSGTRLISVHLRKPAADFLWL